MVLSRAREKGMEGLDLIALGEREAMPAFVAAGLFLQDYLDNLDDQSATDYADLIRRAVIEATAHRDELRRQFRHVFVDEYQDTDPGQVALLRALAGDGGDLTVVGDPHQSIYGFRGAEVRGILEFPVDFPRADGTPAPVVSLRTTRRFGPRLLVATQRVAGRIGLPGAIDAAAREAFLSPVADEGAATTGSSPCAPSTPSAPRPSTSPTCSAGPTSRTASRGTGWPCWSAPAAPASRRCAARSALPGCRSRSPATTCPSCRTRPCCRCSTRCAPPSTSTTTTTSPPTTSTTRGPSPSCWGPSAASTRATYAASPGCSAPARRTPPTPRAGCRSPRASWSGARCCATASSTTSRRPRRPPPGRVHTLIRETADGLAAGGTAEDALWRLWSGTGWPGKLRRAVESGGGAARRAHRDLDSVVALFDVAAREAEKRDVAAVSGAHGVRDFLARLVAQQIPADTLAEQGVRGSAVRLLTAHRSKGLEWDLVVVAHVQQDGWPDLRRRSTMLQADRIGGSRAGSWSRR